MIITIHRGTRQIGGCCTEIQTANARIFIDFGTELPDRDGKPKVETLSVPGLTDDPARCDGVLFTHSHGDHIGNIHRILSEVPLFMGETSRQISLILNEKLQYAHEKYPEDFPHGRESTLAALKRADVFQPGEVIGKLNEKGITVTPLRVDHSAFDSYMFLIEAEGTRILHTGDFRDHGYTGKTLIPMLEKYAQGVDWLITEGTMLSRESETVMTEAELSEKAHKIMEENKNVFVLCSSTNIDRIRAIYRAAPRYRRCVCDRYQKDVLEAVEQSSIGQRYRYQFQYVIPDSDWNQTLHKQMEQNGFVMFVRATDKFHRIMDPYRGNCKVIYSMWNGYLEQESIRSFLEGYDYEPLHTSGHATQGTLQAVYHTVRPHKGVIPIHGEYPERFRQLFTDAHIMLPADGKPFELP